MNIPLRAFEGFFVPGIPKLIHMRPIDFVAKHLQAYIKPTPHYNRIEIEQTMMKHESVTFCECNRIGDLVLVVVSLTNNETYRLTVRWADPVS